MKIRQKISAGAVLVFAALFVGSASAATVSIDFSTLAQGSVANSDPNAVAGGITFAPATFLPTLDSNGIPIPGSEHWQVDTSSSAVTVESTIAQGWGTPPSGTPNALDARLSPVLLRSNGSSISGLSFLLPNSTFGDAPPSQILFLGSGGSVLGLFNFTEGVPNASNSFVAPAGAPVTDVLLASGTMYRDLSVSTVPLPAAAWLLVSGLGLLGLRRRKEA